MAAILRTPRLIISRCSSSLFSTRSSKKRPPLSTIEDVKSAMESTSNPEKLFDIMEKYSDFSQKRRHSPIFRHSIHRLAEFGRPDLVDRILMHHRRYSVGLPMFRYEDFWICLIMLYSKSGMVNQGMKAFRQMDKFYCIRTEKSLRAVLTLHLNNELYDKVNELFLTLPNQIRVSASVQTYNLVLKSFCLNNDMESVRELLLKMENEDKVMPNVDSYNILLSNYLKNGNEVGFDGVLKEMEEKGLDFNLATYHHWISRYCKINEFVRAKEVLDEMVSKGLKPKPVSYNAIIDGLCTVKDWASATNLLGRMIADGNVTPSSFAYYSMIKNMVEEGEFDMALALFEETLKLKKWDPPPTDVVKDIVTELVKMSRTQEAKEIVEKMKMMKKGRKMKWLSKIVAAIPS